MPITTTHQQDTALFVAAFFDEMVRWGVARGGGEPRLAVDGLGHGGLRAGAAPTPGSASLRGYRRARGCFSRPGSCEGERSPRGARVHLGHGLGELLPGSYRGGNVPGAAHRSVWRPAPAAGASARRQTTDQLKAYGSHVRSFRAMPTPRGRDRDIAFARQAAREAVLAALGPTATLVSESRRR